MKRTLAFVAALAIAAAAITTGFGRSPLASADNGSTPTADVVRFHTMFGNHAPFIGSMGAIRGVPAAGLPWMIRSVQGHLDTNGRLTIDVDRLVLARDPSVPAGLRGTNPVPFFVGVVSCLTSSGGTVSTSNVMTSNFAATMPGGDARIDQRLVLPQPCVAPVVLVTAPGGGPWFAATGG